MTIKKFFKLSQKNGNNFQLLKKQQQIKNHPYLAVIQKNKTISYLLGKLNHTTQLFILGSAEANAITTALLDWHNKKLKLIPARLHTGPKRSLDNTIACFQAMQIKELQPFFKTIKNLDENLLLIDLLREGQKTQVQEAICYLFDAQPSNVLMSIHHIDDKSTPLARKAKIEHINFEGVNFSKIKKIIISDSVASGVTQFYALEYLKNKLPQLKEVLILSPHLTKLGTIALTNYCKHVGLKLNLIGYTALLNSNPPDFYFSPTPIDQPKKFVQPAQAELMSLIYGKKVAQHLGVAGNWSAMFLAPKEGLKWLEIELKKLNSSIKKIKKQKISLAKIASLKIKITDLLPTSTYLKAINLGELELLKKVVT